MKSLGLKHLTDLAAVSDLRPLYLARGARELAYNNPGMVMNVFDVQGHMILGHKNVIRNGFAGVPVS